jgi:hypothetical protein
MTLTVHVDHYDDTNLAVEIDGYDRRRDARTIERWFSGSEKIELLYHNARMQ